MATHSPTARATLLPSSHPVWTRARIAALIGAYVVGLGVMAMAKGVAALLISGGLIGIALACASLIIMPVLSWAQRRAGRELGSLTAVADSKQTLLCTYLSAVLLVGLVVLDGRSSRREGLLLVAGYGAAVAAYIRRQPVARGAIKKLTALLRWMVPLYVQEGKSYLTIAIGCTGGEHRSVYFVEELAKHFRRERRVLARHRELS